MELPEIISRPIRAVKEILDFDNEFDTPTVARQFVDIKAQLVRIQKLLDESRRISREKDELIAKLQAAAKIRGDMVVDGSAYYVQKDAKLVDGPFCTCCFDQNQQTVRLLCSPKPEGATGEQWEWVQCPKCQTPFWSPSAGQRLNPQHAAPKCDPAPTTKTADETESPKTRKRTPRTRRKTQKPTDRGKCETDEA